MQITHVESSAVLADRARTARNHWQRFRGLMLQRSIQPGEALVIEPCSSIHMMFMLFRIDAIFFDRSGRITKVARGVKPWIGLAFGGRGARGVVELPAGTTTGIVVGHHLLMTETSTLASD